MKTLVALLLLVFTALTSSIGQTVGDELNVYQEKYPNGTLKKNKGNLLFTFIDEFNWVHCCEINKKSKICFLEYIWVTDRQAFQNLSEELDEDWSILDTGNWELRIDGNFAYHASALPTDDEPGKVMIFYLDFSTPEKRAENIK